MSTSIDQSSAQAASAATHRPGKRHFAELTQEWRKATEFSSSTTTMAMHPAYQQIIGMGDAALPFIFQELRRDPDHWFWALKAITGEDPVAASDRGQLDKMTAAWLNWAEQHGY
jgi:hypothetical protein